MRAAEVESKHRAYYWSIQVCTGYCPRPCERERRRRTFSLPGSEPPKRTLLATAIIGTARCPAGGARDLFCFGDSGVMRRRRCSFSLRSCFFGPPQPRLCSEKQFLQTTCRSSSNSNSGARAERRRAVYIVVLSCKHTPAFEHATGARISNELASCYLLVRVEAPRIVATNPRQDLESRPPSSKLKASWWCFLFDA